MAYLDNTGLTKLIQLIKGSLPTKATTSALGLVKPDNTTITVDNNGAIAATSAVSYDHTASGLSSSTVKTAIDELASSRLADALVSTDTNPSVNNTINWVYS